ncbi:MAG: HU family DNA-binding protein [Bradymonadales bacterium]|nr:MAG: HU family DNA-binding protein [Bradymonadales bacterium]
MTKAELVNNIAKHNPEVSKRLIGEILDDAFDNLAKGIKKDKRFTYPGFGTWTMKTRKARKGVNPQTGQRITIKASKTCTFKPSIEFKKNLNRAK